MNKMPLSLYIDRHHCCNKEVVSVGTRLKLYHIHDSLFSILFFLYLLMAGVRMASCIYVSTAISELPRGPCRKYLRGSGGKKKLASAWKLPKISSSNKKIYIRGVGASHNLCHGPSRF
jgi:hypothetical protein